jgi:cysteine-rich repeat protein
MPVFSLPSLAATLSLALLGASCSLTTDLSGLQRGTGAGGGGGSITTATTTTSSSSSSSSSGLAVCGDGIIQGEEECDDGSSVDGDGCADCVVECGKEGEIKETGKKLPHCYFYDTSEPRTFDEAKTFCAGWRKDANLAAITSEIELVFLVVQKTIPYNTWIGASDVATPGHYKWVTGEAWDYTNWAPGNPDPNVPFGHCVAFLSQDQNWYNTACLDKKNTLCESSPAGKLVP